MKTRLVEFLKSEDGQGMVEYGLIIGLISVGVVAVLVTFGPKIVAYFQSAEDAITPAS